MHALHTQSATKWKSIPFATNNFLLPDVTKDVQVTLVPSLSYLSHQWTQGRSQEETTTEANTGSVVRNQPYEIFQYYQSDKKNKNRQYLIKFYRGECLGSPHTGYGGGTYSTGRENWSLKNKNLFQILGLTGSCNILGVKQADYSQRGIFKN